MYQRKKRSEEDGFEELCEYLRAKNPKVITMSRLEVF